MPLLSKNMNYIFHVEYFNNLDFKNLGNDENEKKIGAKNQEITSFLFPQTESPLAECQTMDGYSSFSLFTLYPGLLVGIGNPHELAVAGAIKNGFTFDYVTGLPYITGSTLKGMIRSYFPGDTESKEKDAEYNELIKGILGKEDIDVLSLKENMFINNDLFLGGFPNLNQAQALLEMEYITSHKEKFKDPNPVSMIKVKPGVEYVFSFVMSDYVDEKSGKVIVSAAEKVALCEELILLMGIGAKTNVGFGRFSKIKPKQNRLVPRPEPNHNIQHNTEQHNRRMNNDENAPKCKTKGCNNTVNKRPGTNEYFAYCRECSQKNRQKK